ncbi:MAG: sulfatase [bacterium]|nr:sulfatase [bacterium]
MPEDRQPDSLAMRTTTRRQFLGRTLALGAAGALGGLDQACSSLELPGDGPRRRPNLVYIFSDEHSHDMLGCYGNEQIITPNLDRFAGQGIRFNHCVSNGPVCTPYRSMLMSGQHCLYNGAYSNDIRMLAGGGNYFGEVLRDAGYRMGYVGKWHLYGGDRDRPIPPGPYRYGFDGYFLSNNCTLVYDAGQAWYWDEEGKKRICDDWEPYTQTRQALKFIDDCARNPEQPFALFVSYHPPHERGIVNNEWVYETLPELMSKYDRDKIRVRPNARDSALLRRYYHGSMAMVTGIDQCFGRIADKLKEKGLEEDTIMVFTSDHGDLLTSCGKPWPKGFAEDGSCRVPLLLRWPGRIQAGTVSDLLFGTLDFMPTLLNLAGLKAPRTCQGHDLSRAILERRDDAIEAQPLCLVAIGDGWRGVYTHEHTFAYDREKPGQEVRFNCLYDKKKDPWQNRNLFDESSARPLKDEMRRLTHRLMERFGDTFVSGSQVNTACFGQARQPRAVAGETGVLSGRPIDLIKSL